MALLSFTRRLTPISLKYISLIMAQTLTQTDLHLPGQDHVYHGKVRDVYFLKDGRIVMVATDRISAFDVVLPEGIPYKGQVLNQIATYFLEATKDMVIRGYLTGSAWRAYRAGERTLCGVELPEGMKENEAFASPIITPTTKEDEGHDENISKEEIIRTGLVSKEDYEQLEAYTYALFRRGQEMARERGLILVDTKYEFGKGEDGTIYLIDEIHTPDSSRYFYAEGYEERFQKGEEQKQLSKEFVRQWLIKHGFQGRAGEVIPTMTPEYCREVSDRYIELYELVTGRPFVKEATDDLTSRIEHNLLAALR